MYHQDLLMSIMLRHSGQNPNERPRPRAILNKNTHAISHNLKRILFLLYFFVNMAPTILRSSMNENLWLRFMLL